MRALALIATYNEERFIGGCLEHLFSQGVEAYLCDNQSTDDTVAIAERYLGAGLRGIEHIPRDGTYRWRQILRRKEALAAELEADWFLHLDADEVPLPPRSGQTLAEGLAEADAGGCNVVELLGVHLRADPGVPRSRPLGLPPHHALVLPLRSHRAPPRASPGSGRTQPVDLATTGGHVVRFPGWRFSPHRFRLLSLSLPQP